MKGTVNIQARIDIISLAQVVQYFDSLNYKAQTKSDAVWKAVEMVKNSAIRQEKCVVGMTVEDAVHYLDEVGLSLRTNERARRSVASALQDEVKSTDFAETAMPVDNLYADYVAAVAMAKKMGREYPSFDEFKARLEKIRKEQEDGLNS
jgi:hypothetical protein